MRTLRTPTTPRLCSDSLPSVVKPAEPYEYLSGLKVSAKLVTPPGDVGAAPKGGRGRVHMGEGGRAVRLMESVL